MTHLTSQPEDTARNHGTDVPLLSATNSHLELTLIINTDLSFIPTTRLDSNPSEYGSAKFRSYTYIKRAKLKLPDSLLRNNKGS